MLGGLFEQFERVREFAFNGIRSPGRLAPSETLYQLRYLGSQQSIWEDNIKIYRHWTLERGWREVCYGAQNKEKFFFLNCSEHGNGFQKMQEILWLTKEQSASQE
jgi:hypothetical protein